MEIIKSDIKEMVNEMNYVYEEEYSDDKFYPIFNT